MTKICNICKKEKNKYRDFRRGNQCKQCLGKFTKEWKIKNKEKYSLQRKEYWKSTSYELRLKQHLKKNFNLSLEDYSRILKEQGDVCKICGLKERRKGVFRLSVDHCHKTGIIRGLLCSRCNAALGHVNDDTRILESMIIYLKLYE